MEEFALNKPVFPVYYSYIDNFGDQLNVFLLRKMYPIQPRHEFFHTSPFIGIGSILDRLLDNSILHNPADIPRRALCRQDEPIHVWGSGLMYAYDPAEQKPLRPMVIHALRGERTRATMEAVLGRPIRCVLADPGLLASRFVPALEKRYELGIIPHLHDAADPRIAELREHYPDTLLINVKDKPEVVLQQISQCRHILSTSLHGVIVADAYNIPSCWCELSDKVEGSGYKFHDYFSAFGTDRECFDLRTGAWPDLAQDFRTSFSDYSEVAEKQKALLRCFPRSLVLRAWLRAIRAKGKSLLKKLRKALRR